jgi:nucleotide-binding universal stress UspA family protein
MALAASLVERVLAQRYFAEVMAWLERKSNEPVAWQEAAQFGDSSLRVTADELGELGRQIDELVQLFEERIASAGARPPEARSVWLLHLAFPAPADGESAKR